MKQESRLTWKQQYRKTREAKLGCKWWIGSYSNEFSIVWRGGRCLRRRPRVNCNCPLPSLSVALVTPCSSKAYQTGKHYLENLKHITIYHPTSRRLTCEKDRARAEIGHQQSKHDRARERRWKQRDIASEQRKARWKVAQHFAHFLKLFRPLLYLVPST